MHIAPAIFGRPVGRDLLLQIVQRLGGHPVPLVRIIQMIQRARASTSTSLRDIHGQRQRHDQKTRKRVRIRTPECQRSRPECCKFTTASHEDHQKNLQKNHLDSNEALAEDHAESNGQLQKNQQNPVNIIRIYIYI